MDEAWVWARVDKARAYWFDEHLLLEISGMAPDPCYEIDLEQSLLDVEPPTFVARWRRLPENCPRVETPYHHREIFRIGVRRETICVVHESGKLAVDVEDYAPDQEPAELLPGAPGEGEPLISNAYDPKSRTLLPFNEAVGESAAWSLEEAMRDAIRALPPRGTNVPDWLSTYEVVSIGAESGGIAGRHHLVVRVRG